MLHLSQTVKTVPRGEERSLSPSPYCRCGCSPPSEVRCPLLTLSLPALKWWALVGTGGHLGALKTDGMMGLDYSGNFLWVLKLGCILES